jgi:outer membrane protein
MRTSFRTILISAWLIATPAFAADQSTELTLQDCYTLALGQSETVGIQKQLIKETEGQMLQALSTALPNVSFSYSETRQDNSGEPFKYPTSHEGKFVFTQPLFTGFREFAAISGSKHLGRQRKHDLKRAQQLLFTDVSDAFYLYLNYQQDYETVTKTRDALLERVAELEKREALGRSRPSEVASTVSRLRIAEATLESVASQKEIAGQLLEFLVWQKFDRLVEDTGLPGENDQSTADDYYAKAGNRPDVLAAAESLEVFKKQIAVARASYFPTVDLTADSYTTKRTGASEGVDWDVVLDVNVPIFNGFNSRGQVIQARAQANEADLILSRTRRNALLEIRNAFTKWQSDRKQLQALDKAVAASEKSYQLQVEDFQRNLVNNLEVLQALEDLQGVRRNLVAAITDTKRSYWNLLVATGVIPQ